MRWVPEGIVFEVVSTISKRLAGVGILGDGENLGKADTAGSCVTDSYVRIQLEKRDEEAAASLCCDKDRKLQEAPAKASMAILV